MTRTSTTIIALALACIAAPAFARGGGMSHGGNHQPDSHTTSSTTWNKVTNTDAPGAHHTSVEHQQRIMRLEAELRRLGQLEVQEKQLIHPGAAHLIALRIKRLLIELKREGVNLG
jgi:hypothetical protein